MDPITDLERQRIGVTMPVPEHASMHGALIMSLLPERTAKSTRTQDAGDYGLLSSASGTICFVADSTDGVIVFSSKPGMTKKLVSECGLSEDSLRDGVMDFATIAGSNYLMITSRDDNSVFYYAVGTDTAFGRIILIGAVISLIFTAALALFLVFLMNGYDERTYREWEEIRTKEKERIKKQFVNRGDIYDSGEDNGVKKNILRKLLALIDWERKSAGGKAAMVLRVGTIVLILCALQILHKKLLPDESFGTMLGFFISGGWTKGLNLFSLCGILLLIVIAYLINVICSLLMKLTGGLVSENTEKNRIPISSAEDEIGVRFLLMSGESIRDSFLRRAHFVSGKEVTLAEIESGSNSFENIERELLNRMVSFELAKVNPDETTQTEENWLGKK